MPLQLSQASSCSEVRARSQNAGNAGRPNQKAADVPRCLHVHPELFVLGQDRLCVHLRGEFARSGRLGDFRGCLTTLDCGSTDETMIGKAELREKLSEFLSSTDSPSAVQEGIAQFLSYSVENYNDLDAEAKAHIDHVFEELKTQAHKVATVLPEGLSKRNFERVLGAAEGRHFNVATFLDGLESPTQISLPIVAAARDTFAELLQRILDFLFDTTKHTHQGHATFAIIGLLYWAVDELLVAMHLAQRGFANQSYAHIRTVDEILDKAKLFHEQPQWATLWATGSDKDVWEELAPAVRAGEKLGQERRESGGPWRSKNRPPEICLRKRSQEERFVGYRRDVHSGAICTRSARGLC